MTIDALKESRMALAYMEAALDLLDNSEQSLSAAAHLDLAIHRLAEETGIAVAFPVSDAETALIRRVAKLRVREPQPQNNPALPAARCPTG